MEIKPINNETDYEAALNEIEGLLDAEPGTPQGDRLDILTTLVEAYENQHYPVPLPDPIEAIKYHMQRLGLSRQDLVPIIGSRARVSEILNRRRRLTLKMIRRLTTALGIPAAILVQEYELGSLGRHVRVNDVSRLGDEYDTGDLNALLQSQGTSDSSLGNWPPLEVSELETSAAADMVRNDASSTSAILVSNWPTAQSYSHSEIVYSAATTRSS